MAIPYPVIFLTYHLHRLGDGKKKAGGFTKLCSISPALQEFVGASECARTEVPHLLIFVTSIPHIR
uniref:Uncharacterized protein n=1 Tax=Aegilops tauschii subsp. strangulata TaxID=200361 RepID=A0A453LWC7_AEGTS